MTTSLRILLTALGVAGLCRLAAAAPATTPAARPADVPDADVGRLFRPLVDGEWCPGVVVGVVTPGGSRVYGYGRSSDAGSRPPDGETVYEIGSVSKVYTSLLLALTAGDGTMALGDPVQQYLPPSVNMPRRGAVPITLEHLATHTSGLPRMPDNFRPADPANPYADYAVGQMYDFLNRCQPARDPGAGYEYSNLGVGLLGNVVARRAGKTYEQLLAERITGPLGMRDTGITLRDDQRRRFAPGHDADGDPVPSWDFLAFAGAGAIRSTVNDQLRFLAAQLGMGGLTPELAKAIELTHARRAAAGDGVGIGLGWHVTAATGMVWHNGQTGGYHSFVAFHPEHRVGVVALTNTASGTVEGPAIALLRRLTGGPLVVPNLPKAVALKREQLDEYAGHYLMAAGLLVTVTRDGDRLYAQLFGQPKFRIYAESEGHFFWKVVAAKVDFVAGGDGRVVKLVHHQNGRDTTAWRIRPQTRPAE